MIKEKEESFNCFGKMDILCTYKNCEYCNEEIKEKCWNETFKGMDY